MKFNLKQRINPKISNFLYFLIVAGHHEDYVSEENGKIVRTPAHIWHANALAKQR